MGLKNVNLGSLIIASVFLMWFYLHFRNINYILSGYCSEEQSLIVWSTQAQNCEELKMECRILWGWARASNEKDAVEGNVAVLHEYEWIA